MACFRRQYLGDSRHPMAKLMILAVWTADSKKLTTKFQWFLWKGVSTSANIYFKKLIQGLRNEWHKFGCFTKHILNLLYTIIYLPRSWTSTFIFNNQRAFSTTQGSDSSRPNPPGENHFWKGISKTPSLEGSSHCLYHCCITLNLHLPSRSTSYLNNFPLSTSSFSALNRSKGQSQSF